MVSARVEEARVTILEALGKEDGEVGKVQRTGVARLGLSGFFASPLVG